MAGSDSGPKNAPNKQRPYREVPSFFSLDLFPMLPKTLILLLITRGRPLSAQRAGPTVAVNIGAAI
jgi:hypothetical protein